MKIGILTFHNGYNFGAYLQAYALSSYLLSLNHDVEIINYKSKSHTRSELWGLRSKRPKKLVGNIIKALKFEKCIQQLPLTERFYDQQKLENLDYDVVVYGSDSVWNYTSPLIGFEKAYFSGAVNARKHVAYAVSFGPDRYEHGYPEQLAPLLKNYSHAGVRDSNTKGFYEQLTGFEATKVLDPSFLHDFTSLAVKPRLQDYILVYTTGMDAEKISSVRKLASTYKKKIVSVGYYDSWADINLIGLSPFEWVGLILHADFVVTTMYHGMLFSVQLKRPFFVYYDEYRKNKIEDFVEFVGLKDRASMLAVNLQERWENPCDWKDLGQNLDEKLEVSKKFIGKALETI